MSRFLYNTCSLDILSNLNIPDELLMLSSYGKNYILVVGPNLIKPEATDSCKCTSTYLKRLLWRMLEWCIQENIIQQQDTINDLFILLDKNSLVSVAYKIEEYLCTKQQKQRCLLAALYSCNHTKAIHYYLTSIPFKGFVVTSYDTCIEAAYEQTHHHQLHKLYNPFLSNAVDYLQNKQPFILKPYADLDNITSLSLGHRLLTGIFAEDKREYLYEIFSKVPALFIGFEDTDEDFRSLKGIARNSIVIHQKHAKYIIEYDSSHKTDTSIYFFEPPSQHSMLLAVHNPPHDSKQVTKEVSRISSRSLSTKQDSQKALQQNNKGLITIFTFYAPEDKKYKDGVEEVVNALKNKEQKPFDIVHVTWAMGESLAYKTDIKHPLESKDLVILLISRHFLGSRYYDKKQMQEVVKRHGKDAWICPILVRPCNWQGTQFDDLEECVLPRNHIAIMKWKPQDDAYLDISQGLEHAINYLADR